MSDITKERLAKAVEIVDGKFGAGASENRPELVSAVLESLVVEQHTPAPPNDSDVGLSWPSLTFATFIFLWWLFLVVVGYQVDSSVARSLLGTIGSTAITVTSAQTVPDVLETNVPPVLSSVTYKTIVDGKEISSITNLVERTTPKQVAATPDKTRGNYFRALIIAVLCWTWPNLIFLAAAASAFSGVLVRDGGKAGREVLAEVGWAMVNGFFVVLFLGCGQIFLGDTAYRTLGLSEALQTQMKQDRYLSLAFFASLLGLFLGLAQSRLTTLPANLPIIGFLFKKSSK